MDGSTLGAAIALIKKNKPTDEQIESAVDNWLDDHPEATTTVQDGSITKAKLDSNLQGTVDEVDDLKDIVAIQSTQPTYSDNKIWIDTTNTPTGIEVPTYTELTDLMNDFDDLFTKDVSENLFDKTTAISGKYFSLDGSLNYVGIGNDSGTYIAYIPIVKSGNYSFWAPTDYMGTYKSKAVPMFDENETNIGVLVGSLDNDDNNIGYFAVTSSHISSGLKYIGLTVKANVIDTAMVVKSSTYPSEYIPYYDNGYVIDGKVAVNNVTGISDYVDNKLSPVESEIDSLDSSIGIVETKFDSLMENFSMDVSENLLDKTTAINGKYFIYNGSLEYGGIGNDSSTSIVYVPVSESGSYSFWAPTDYYGSYKSKVVALFNASKEYVKNIVGSLDSQNDNIGYFSIGDSDISGGARYVGITVKNNALDTAMLVKSATYPSRYIPYYNNGFKFDGKVERQNIIDFIIEHEKTENMFNYNDATYGYYFGVNGSGVYAGLVANGGSFISYVKINGAGNYSYKNAQNIFGTYITRFVPVFDENKEIVKVITGTIDSYDDWITHFEITSEDIEDGAYYIGYSVKSTTIGNAMIVKSSTYPADYIPYNEGYLSIKQDLKITPDSILSGGSNPLYNKKVIFDGDSICQDGEIGGWAKIIGNRNGMIWENEGVAGGTITAGTTAGGSNRHWVSRSIDDIHDKFDSLDYLIFEGGTNDADLLSDNEIGTIDMTNFDTFDDTTFVGALESLFFKATSYYPSAKIGFIVAQKMGYSSTARYDAGSSPSTRRRRMFFEKAIEVCKKWGIPYIDLWEGSPLCPRLECYYDSTMTSEGNTEAGKAYIDGQHLTQVGYNIITPKIEAWMKTL